MQRLATHPTVADALTAGEISESWARQICEWTDLLPDSVRADAEPLALTRRAKPVAVRRMVRMSVGTGSWPVIQSVGLARYHRIHDRNRCVKRF